MAEAGVDTGAKMLGVGAGPAATVQSTICEDIVCSATRHDDCLTG